MARNKRFFLFKIIFTLISLTSVVVITGSCTYYIGSYSPTDDNHKKESCAGVSLKKTAEKKYLTAELPSPLSKDTDNDYKVESTPEDQSDCLEGSEEIEVLSVDEKTEPEKSEQEIGQPQNEESTREEASDSPQDSSQSQQETQHTGGLAYLENDIFEMINHIRVSSGISALTLNGTLTAVARHRAEDMIARGYFSHVTPEGKSIYDVLAGFGVAYATAGENIQYCSPPGWKSLEGFIDTWMASQGHRENILNAGFTQVGVGIIDGNDKRMAVLIFTD